MMELLSLYLLRQTLVVFLLGIAVLLLLRRIRAPRVHRIACVLVLVQGVILLHLGFPESAPAVEEAVVLQTGSPLPEAPPLYRNTVLRTETTVLGSGTVAKSTVTAPEKPAVPAGLTTVVRRYSPILIFVWLAGAALMFARGVFRYLRFHLCVPLLETANDKLRQEWNRACEACGTKSVPLLISQDVGPAVMLRPTGIALIVPSGFLESLSSLRRESVLIHEAQHLKRRDLAKSLGIRVFALLQWFNPIAWRLVGRFDEAAEWACDEHCRRLLPNAVAEFARTLLDQVTPTAALPQPSAGMNGQNLATRIRRLLAPEPRKESNMKRICVLVAFCLLALLSPLEPWTTAFAQSGKPLDDSAPIGGASAPNMQLTDESLSGTEVIAEAQERLVYEPRSTTGNTGTLDVNATRYVQLPIRIKEVNGGDTRIVSMETRSPYMLAVRGVAPGWSKFTVQDESGEKWSFGFNVRKPAGSSKSDILDAKLRQLRALEAEIEKLRGPLIEWKTQLYEVPVDVLEELVGRKPGDARGFSGVQVCKPDGGLLEKLKGNKSAKLQSIPTVVSRAAGKARVLSGGEMPVQVPAGPNGGSVPIEFRSFGLSLEATAQVADDNSLDAKIWFELSERDFSSAVTVDGIQVPGFTVRRGDVQAKLRSGETLQMIGPTSVRYKRVPFANLLTQAAVDIGALDPKTERTETALVVFLTPSLVMDSDAAEPKVAPQSSPQEVVAPPYPTAFNDVAPRRSNK